MGTVCTRRGHTTLAALTLLLMTGVFASADETTPIKSLRNASVGPDGRGQPVSMQMQGSFFAGGNVITGANGDTFHGDAAYVEFQIPHNARDLPMVMWHGGGQFTKTWESTPDGRDGYQQNFHPQRILGLHHRPTSPGRRRPDYDRHNNSERHTE